ncbi:hypothetical protein BD779DRAFT_1551650 [Infundibulicybe gibba]|nr:hypothetical protein BD779DRAFT_1551650 [Infundibulicybe gibba]
MSAFDFLPWCSGIAHRNLFKSLSSIWLLWGTSTVNMLSQNAQLMPPWQVSMSILHALAIGSTGFRLSQRYTSQRLWYDDYTALFAVIMDCVFFVVLHVWTRSEPNGTTFGKETTITFYWISGACFPLVTWFAKVSLALAIARIFPPGRTIRRFAMGMAWSFGLLGILIFLGLTISCGRDSSWHDSPEVQCDLPSALGVTTLCAILIADILLVFTPLRMLWRVKLPIEQRRLIFAGFTASVWTSIAGGVCFTLAFGPNGRGLSQKTIRPLLGHAVASVSLMVCNSMVMDLERSISEAASESSNMLPLTTIVLTDPGSSDDISQNSYRRGVSYNGYLFSEQNLASSIRSPHFPWARWSY